MEYPEFTTPRPLPDGRTWTARLDSFNERTDELFYLVRVDGGPEFTLSVWPGVDIESALARQAATGVSNTEYRGYNR